MHLELAERYGTAHVLEEKTAGEAPLVARLSAALLNASYGHAAVKSQAEQREEAELLNLAAEELEKTRLRPATSALQHTRSPTFIGKGRGFLDPSLVPLGMDEGMVRLASIADASGRTLVKVAGIGYTGMMAGAGKLLGQGAKALGGTKGSLALGAGVLGAGYLGTKAVRGGLKALGNEGGPKNYGAGNYQVPMGVNEYGHPQLGTPLA